MFDFIISQIKLQNPNSMDEIYRHSRIYKVLFEMVTLQKEIFQVFLYP